jgi:hypothetical protein
MRLMLVPDSCVQADDIQSADGHHDISISLAYCAPPERRAELSRRKQRLTILRSEDAGMALPVTYR